MLLSKTIQQLVDIYNISEKKCKISKNKTLYDVLYTELQNASAKPNNKGTIKKQWKMCCESYIESQLINFNVSTAAVLIALASLVVNVGNSGFLSNELMFMVIVLVILFGLWAIKMHIRERKIRAIKYVLDKIK